MKISKTLEKLLSSKNELLESIEVCCKSVEFWEERADQLFKKMDDFESSITYKKVEQADEKKYDSFMKESDKIMARINFENDQLDILEARILDLEETIIKALSKYAKKQKK